MHALLVVEEMEARPQRHVQLVSVRALQHRAALPPAERAVDHATHPSLQLLHVSVRTEDVDEQLHGTGVLGHRARAVRRGQRDAEGGVQRLSEARGAGRAPPPPP